MPGFIVNPGKSPWNTNVVLNGRSKRFETLPSQGYLSIKTMARGVGRWHTSKGDHLVNEGTYLVLNKDQTYSVDINSREIAETFCVFFKPGFVEGVLRALTLDPDNSRPINELRFFERLDFEDPWVSPLLPQIYGMARSSNSDSWEAEELMLRLAEGLIRSQSKANTEGLRLATASQAVREELHARLNKVRDRVLSEEFRALDLESMAEEACLSPFHFHRLFKQAFGETPLAFVNRNRLRVAKRLLEQGWGTAETCSAVGLSSVPSFISWFRKAAGSTPGQFAAVRE